MSDVLITGTPPAEQTLGAERAQRFLLAGRHGRRLREALLAYLFLLPAFLIVGTFGLFPIIFAAYQSTLRGINKVVGEYDGLGNYLKAIAELTYVLGFWGAVLLAALGLRMLWRGRRRAAAAASSFWLWALVGVPLGLCLLTALAWLLRLLPLLLAIPEQMRGRRNTTAMFRQLLWEALSDPTVLRFFWTSLALLGLGIAAAILLGRRRPGGRRAEGFSASFTGAVVLVGLGAALFWLTWSELERRIGEAGAAGGLDLWSQIVVISAGFLLLLLSWRLWESASGRATNAGVFLRLAGAAALLVGAWLLIAELPRVIGSGDETWWYGLLATFYYALGTVPAQLVIALLLAVLLFQNIAGRPFFRIVYFLPYIAPFVGTAAVFKLLFSSRPTGAINSLLGLFGVPPQQWLSEPTGIFNLLWPGPDLPQWAAGPSLALVVIMAFGVWTFFGFNTVVFLAGLGNIPRETYEAASIDGAGRWAQFRHITLPLLSPTLYFLTLYSVIGTFKAFNHIYVLRTGAALGTTDTASVVIFQTFKRDTRFGYASALAILLLLIIVLLTVVNNRVAARRVHYG